MCSTCPDALADDLAIGFPLLVEHHRDLVHSIAWRSMRDAHDAEDVAQDAFLRAYRALRAYEEGRIRALRPRAWLARITLNVARDRVRRAGPVVGRLDGVEVESPSTAAAPEPAALARESAAGWLARLDRLPFAQRQAVGLRHVDGLSYPEVAQALGRPIGTVKSDVHRGVAALRRALEDEGRRDEDGTEARYRREAGMRARPEVMVRCR